jgi:hypothetical protein
MGNLVNDLLSLAAQLSGYTNPKVAIVLAGIATALLIWTLWHNAKKWHRSRVLAGERGVEPSHLIFVGIAGAWLFLSLALVGFIWQRYWQPTINQVTESAASQPTASASVKPGKFYSQRNKNEIADALTDLSNILNTTGGDVVNKTQQIMSTWNAQVQTPVGQQPDINVLFGQVNDLEKLTVALNRALYDDDGFLKKYETYKDELDSVLQLPRNAPNYNPITKLQMSINELREGISPILLAEKYNDQRLTVSIIQSMQPRFRNLQTGDDAFRAWLDQTKRRIDDFRHSLL